MGIAPHPRARSLLLPLPRPAASRPVPAASLHTPPGEPHRLLPPAAAKPRSSGPSASHGSPSDPGPSDPDLDDPVASRILCLAATGSRQPAPCSQPPGQPGSHPSALPRCPSFLWVPLLSPSCHPRGLSWGSAPPTSSSTWGDPSPLMPAAPRGCICPAPAPSGRLGTRRTVPDPHGADRHLLGPGLADPHSPLHFRPKSTSRTCVQSPCCPAETLLASQST